MIGYERDSIFHKQNEARFISRQFLISVSQHTIAINLAISPFTIHNLIKQFRESGEISASKEPKANTECL